MKLDNITKFACITMLFIAATDTVLAGNQYLLKRGVAQGSFNYNLTIFGDPIHSVHITGVDALKWTPSSPTGWSASGGLPTGINWYTIEYENRNLGSSGTNFHFEVPESVMDIDFRPMIKVSVDKIGSNIDIPIPPVPEPASTTLILSGLAWLSRKGLKKRVVSQIL